MNRTFRVPKWLDPKSPAPTFIFIGALVVLALLLANRGSREDYAAGRVDPAAPPVPLMERSQLSGPLGEKKLTAVDQYLERHELELVRGIRERIRQDARLSSLAKQAMVVSSEAAVTLRGYVTSEHEKDLIGWHAANATDKRVNNELIVN